MMNKKAKGFKEGKVGRKEGRMDGWMERKEGKDLNSEGGKQILVGHKTVPQEKRLERCERICKKQYVLYTKKGN